MDVQDTIMRAVYKRMKAINPNTSPEYPQSLFLGGQGIAWPITVYAVETSSAQRIGRQEVRTNITIRLDHFADTRAAVNYVAQRALGAMAEISGKCTRDAPGMVNGLYRRSQVYTGVYDAGTNTIYT
jgi:hypothetical protein